MLKALLPEAGTDIKGHMRSRQELLEASGYAGRPKDFDDLMRILDGELRLITPTETEGNPSEPEALAKLDPHFANASGSDRYLPAHARLPRSVAARLADAQAEGDAAGAGGIAAGGSGGGVERPAGEPAAAVRGCNGSDSPADATRRTGRAGQRKMMRKASRYHATRGLALLVMLAAVTIGGREIYGRVIEKENRDHAAGLVGQLLKVETAQVPGIVADLQPYRAWADPLLREENDKAATDSRQKLHTSLALLPIDPAPVRLPVRSAADRQARRIAGHP